LLIHLVTRHFEKDPPLYFSHTKWTIHHIPNTWMQMVKELLFTTWSRTPPIWHMVPFTLVWCQVSRFIWVSGINVVIFPWVYKRRLTKMHVKNF
jgi:hypothetical protein